MEEEEEEEQDGLSLLVRLLVLDQALQAAPHVEGLAAASAQPCASTEIRHLSETHVEYPKQTPSAGRASGQTGG